MADGRQWAAALAASAAIVLLGLTVIVAAGRQCKRDRALDLILGGHERLAIAAVQQQRRRLLSQRTRTALARSLEDVVDQGAQAPASTPLSSVMHGRIRNAVDERCFRGCICLPVKSVPGGQRYLSAA